VATLDSEFESKLESAVLDEVEQDLRRPDGPVAKAIERSKKKLRLYADKYDVEPVLETLEGPEVNREGDSITVEWSFEHGAAGLFETGTTDHVIEGSPVVSFVWEDAPPEVREQFDETFPRVFFQSVEVGGIDETRFTRHGLEVLRYELSDSGV